MLRSFTYNPLLSSINPCILFILGTTGWLKDPMVFEFITFVPDVLETACILHVALLVYLRYLAVSQPMNYKETHKKFRRNGIIFIWVVSISSRLLSIITYSPDGASFYHYYHYYIIIHVFHTIPILLIILLRARLMYVILKRKGKNDFKKDALILSNLGAENDESIRKRTAQMVQIMIILVLISYVPFIIWWQYYNVITINRGPSVQICTRIFRLHCSKPKVNTSEVRNSMIMLNDFSTRIELNSKRYILFRYIYIVFRSSSEGSADVC